MVRPPTSKPPAADDDRLHLRAVDTDDLAIVSAHVQDAIVRIADMAFQPKQRRFAFIATRFDWASLADGVRRRRIAGVHFDHVRQVQRQGFEQSQKDAVLNLLGVSFDPADELGGVVTLNFSAGAAIRLEVECIEAQLTDLGPAWRTRNQPAHDLAANESSEGAEETSGPSPNQDEKG